MNGRIISFGSGETAADPAAVAAAFGRKAGSLLSLSALGLPVPPGFILMPEASEAIAAGRPSEVLEREFAAALDRLAALTGRRFGDPEAPLLLAVRSGSRASVPGVIGSILDLGLNGQTREGLARMTGARRFAQAELCRFIAHYGEAVLGIEPDGFEDALEDARLEAGVEEDAELTEAHLAALVERFGHEVREATGEDFPQDPHEQLRGAIAAIIASWGSRRAADHRRLHAISDRPPPAVIVQAMVFGSLGGTSASGVASTRNAATGAPGLGGEFLVGAQGSELRSAARMTQDVTERGRVASGSDQASLEKWDPAAFARLGAAAARLERHFADALEIDFTIERGTLWLLETRPARRTAKAALRMAVDLAEEGVIARHEAVLRVDPASLDQLLHPTIAPEARREVIVTGLAASPGAASGIVALSPDEVAALVQQGRPAILVRMETSPEDVHGMQAARGVLTVRGGMTSHAAVVARGLGRPCVVGAAGLRIDPASGEVKAGGRLIRRGDTITVDGSSGQVLLGAPPMIQPELSGHFGTLLDWADGMRRMAVRANADTPADARAAQSFGAEGIGLCRTEHMFFENERIVTMREIILAETEEERRVALARLLPMQRADFVSLFEIMAGMPVTIRLLDPPLHEFLPHGPEEVEQVAAVMGISPERMLRRAEQLREFNPMLGHRGCRLAISNPEIVEMQARAIFEAALEAGERAGAAVVPEIMIPLVSLKAEIDYVKARIDAVARAVLAERGGSLDYRTGTMIELPRAAIRAGAIAETAEFFSFGTNDLTQTAFGISRDDAATFLSTYLRKGIMKRDPFVSIDLDGVGELMELAATRGRATRPGLGLGICGEHGGEPGSIAFCEAIGLDYVSCSPYRVPLARLAAAQATLRAGAAVSSPPAARPLPRSA